MFELLEHPADIGFRAFAATLPDLFAASANAMLSIACEIEQAVPRERYILSAAGADTECLLINWLNEVLYWFDGKQIAFREFPAIHLEPGSIRAEALGEPREAGRPQPKLIVKAVTWHQLRVAQTDTGWLAEVYLDI